MEETRFYSRKDSNSPLLEMISTTSQNLPQCLNLLAPNTVDAAGEKHIPVMEMVDGTLRVQVGSTLHPMLPEHYIEWIFVQTKDGGMYRKLQPGQQPIADFPVKREDVLYAFAFCNLHGLWRDTE